MFGTSGVRGPVGEEVTADLALSIGRALAATEYTRVVVGRDARESGEFLRDALRAGLRECGADVVDLDRASTPAIARAVDARDADAGVAITASHNPAPDNGLKLWNPTGQAFDADQRAAITEAVEEESHDLAVWDELGTASTWAGAAAHHRAAITDAADSLEGISVTVDVGNGMGGVTADALYELGADVETLNAQPDGRFPGRPSEPTAETCASLCRHVANTGTDLGIAHDGDADRMMAVDETGAFVPGDALLALFALQAASEGDRVAAPVNTSLAVDDALSGRGVSVTRTRVGDVFVAERTAEDGVVFGGEPSGTWIWPDETLCPDGPLAAVKLARLVSNEGPLSEQVARIDRYPLRRESVEVDDKEGILRRVREYVEAEYADVDTIDGVRVDDGNGWFMLRASGTQPLVRLTAEARTEERCRELLEEAREVLLAVGVEAAGEGE